MIEINDDKQGSVVLEEDINNKKEENKQQDDYKKIIIFLDKQGCRDNPFSQDKRFFSYDEQMMNGIPITYVDNEEKRSDIGNGFKVVNCKGNNDNNVIYYNYKDDKDWQGKELKERIIFIGKNNNEIYDGFDEDIFVLEGKLKIKEQDFIGCSRFWWVEEIENPMLAAFVKSLSHEDMELVTMAYFEGYSQDEIGKRVGLTQQAVSKRLAKFEKIKENIKNF